MFKQYEMQKHFEREQKLVNMTDDEKKQFLHEEEEAKRKEEAAKKRVRIRQSVPTLVPFFNI